MSGSSPSGVRDSGPEAKAFPVFLKHLKDFQRPINKDHEQFSKNLKFQKSIESDDNFHEMMAGCQKLHTFFE